MNRSDHQRHDPTDQTEWFEDWFDTDLYMALYRHRDQGEADRVVDLVLRQVPLPNDRPAAVLDVAAGPGRHAIALAERGFQVTAVDLSPRLLAHAAEEAAEAGVELQLVRSDMRHIDFEMEFDLVVQLFTSFGYFESHDDDMQVLANVHTSLVADGYYVLDLINRDHLVQTLVGENTRSLDGTIVIERRHIDGDRVVKDIEFVIDGHRVQFRESVRLFSPEAISTMLRESGFEPVRWFGDYRGGEFDRFHSPRMLVISRRTP